MGNEAKQILERAYMEQADEEPKFQSGQIVRHKINGKFYVVEPADSRPEFFSMRPKPGFTAARYSIGGCGKGYGPQRHLRDEYLESAD